MASIVVNDCKEVSAKVVRRVLVKHCDRFHNEIQLANLRAFLLKHVVLLPEEIEQLMHCPPSERNTELIKTLAGKPDVAVRAFVCCLKESPKHTKLAELFDQETQSPGPHSSSEDEDGADGASERIEHQPTSDRLAVLLSIDDYIIQINKASPTSQSQPHHPLRDKLKRCLDSSDFDQVDLKNELANRDTPQSQEPTKDITTLSKLLHNHVSRRCGEQTILFLYVSGSGMGKEEELVAMGELTQWLQLLPTSMVTMVIDCHATQQVEVTKSNLRAVVYSVCSTSQRAGSPPHGLLTEVFVKAFMSWLLRGRPAVVTHRLLYEQMSYLWPWKDQTFFSEPSIQGDMDRTFLGGDGYPYRQWLRADLISTKPPSLPRQRFDLKRVHIRTSKMAGLIVDDMLDVFHICRPEEVFKGKVVEAHQMCAIVAMEDVEALAKLLEEEYQGIPAGPDTDSSMNFLCLRKTFPLHLKENYTVHLDQSLGEEDIAKLKLHIDTSPLLTAVPSLKVSKMEVKREGQAYTIEDRDGDVVYRPKVKNIVHVSSLLEMMAWFKFVIAIRPDDQSQAFPLSYSCYLTSSAESPLLSVSPSPTIYVSSHTGSRPPSAAILQFGPEASFWEPYGDDRSPRMCVILTSSCVVTALEVRGKGVAPSDGNVQVKYCDTAFSKEFTCNNEGVLLLELQVKSFAECVSLWRTKADKEEDVLWYLQFFTAQGDPVQIGGKSIVVWKQLRFDIFPDKPSQLSKMEIRAPQGRVTGKVKVVVHRSSVPLCKVVVPASGFPRRHSLDTPVVASMVLLTLPPTGSWPRSLQVQLYGEKDSTGMEVEEGRNIALWFTNHSRGSVYFSVLCLEETGKIQLLFSDKCAPGKVVKRFIATSMPKGHNVPAITDTYKVFVSQKMMYLEPYIQQGLHEHFCPLRYDVCSYGAGVMDKRDRWDQYEFKVTIRKPTH